ncbi:hypothetical protein BVX94_01635 [bacterium B17]|nr:hypothetical protein BVX94_01635 [bacterium B17]
MKQLSIISGFVLACWLVTSGPKDLQISFSETSETHVVAEESDYDFTDIISPTSNTQSWAEFFRSRFHQILRRLYSALETIKQDHREEMAGKQTLKQSQKGQKKEVI